MSELVKIIDCKDAEIQELRLLIDTLQNRKPISDDARFYSTGQSASQEAPNFPEEPL